MTQQPIQARYPAELNQCYGCGQLNDKGLHITSYWDGTEATCAFQPRPEHTAFPGLVYGGLIASLIDCHSLATAAAAVGAAEGIPETEPLPRFITASLKVDYLKPTPLNTTLTVYAHPTEIKGRKVIIASRLLANGEECARGEVIAIRIREDTLGI